MSIVGNFPGVGLHKRAVRSEVNPMDKSTVVSIYPKPIHEVKHTISPGVFDIAAGSYDNPAILVVGPSSWWRDIDDESPLLEVVNSSIQIADSIVRDFVNGILGCDMNTKMPGLFYVMGAKTALQIKTEHKLELDRALVYQRNWYQELVSFADTMWSRTNGNPMSIDDNMRLAAQDLNMKDKPWMQDFTTITLINCKFCGSLIKPGFPVCQNCSHVVDEELYNKMKPKIAS